MTTDGAIIQSYVEALAASQERIVELEAERDHARRDQRASEQAATDANRENHQLTQRIAELERERSDDQARRIVAEQRVRWLEAWGDEVMLTVCNALGIHPDAVDRDDDSEALGILRDLCEQKAEQLTALEAAARALIGRREPVASDMADMVLVGREAYFALVAALDD